MESPEFNRLRERRAGQIMRAEDAVVDAALRRAKTGRDFKKNNPWTAKTQRFTKKTTGVLRRGVGSIDKKSQQVLGEFSEAAGVGMRQEVSFSREQEMLGEMFGGGDKIWGTNGEPVRINNDLNPSRRGDMGTANIFGFGGDGERSGLF